MKKDDEVRAVMMATNISTPQFQFHIAGNNEKHADELMLALLKCGYKVKYDWSIEQVVPVIHVSVL